jgi:hypothetical protein
LSTGWTRLSRIILQGGSIFEEVIEIGEVYRSSLFGNGGTPENGSVQLVYDVRTMDLDTGWPANLLEDDVFGLPLAPNFPNPDPHILQRYDRAS